MRALLFPIVASLAIHALVAAPVYGPLERGSDAGAVTISYVEPAPESPQKKGKTVRAHIPGKVPGDKAFPERAVIRESAELLTDPQMGRIFHSYFVRLKEKIHSVIRRHSGEQSGEGAVSLVFILGRDGTLDKISVMEKESSAGAGLRSFAVYCVKASAPFEAFPHELDPANISFLITIRFNELSKS